MLSVWGTTSGDSGWTRDGDGALRSLALSGVDLMFDPAVTQYTAEVANDVAETTVTAAPAGATAYRVVFWTPTPDG